MILSLTLPTIREPTRCSQLADHALHEGAVAALLARNNVRDLRAQRRVVLGNDGHGLILTASPFSYSSTIGVPAVDYSHSSTNCCWISTWYSWWVWSPHHTKKRNCLFLPGVTHNILHSYIRGSSKLKSQTASAKGPISEPKKNA